MRLDVLLVGLETDHGVAQRLRDEGHAVTVAGQEDPISVGTTVLDFSGLSEAGRDLWLHELSASDVRRARTLVLANGNSASAGVNTLLATGAVAHVASHTRSERVLRTLEIMNGAELSLATYLPAGRASSFGVTSSNDVRGLRDELHKTIGERLPARAREGLLATAEELVTNALYNAPVDASGLRRFAHWSRRREVTLTPPERIDVELRIGVDEIGLSVRDPFGSLEPYRVLQSLARTARLNPSQVEKKPGGAGLGIYFAMANVGHLVFQLRTGVSTEVIALMPITTNYREFAGSPKSFDVFDRRSPHGR